MDDAIEVVEEQGFFSRLKDALSGVCVGILFLLGGIGFLFYNERISVLTHKTIIEGKKVAVKIPVSSSSRIDHRLEKKLVYFTTTIDLSDRMLSDEQFGVSVPGALSLEREVEMYQWYEDVDKKTRKKLGGGTETVKSYSYYKQWSSVPISDTQFQNRQGHENIYTSFPFESWIPPLTQTGVMIGDFEIPSAILQSPKISSFIDLPPGSISVDNIPDEYAQIKPYIVETVKDGCDGLYLSHRYMDDISNPPALPEDIPPPNPSMAEVGDMRIVYKYVPTPITITVAARQNGYTFDAYKSKKYKQKLFLIYPGKLSKNELFERAVDDNNAATIMLRFIGFVVITLGFYLILVPLNVVADVMPCLGNIVGTGNFCIACTFGTLLSFVVIGISWIAVRPLIGIPFLVGGGALFIWFIRSHFYRKKVLRDTEYEKIEDVEETDGGEIKAVV